MKLRGIPILFIANSTSAAMGFAVLAVLTRALDPHSFGTLSTLLSLMDVGVMVVDILVVTGMVQVAARHLHDDPGRADMAFKLGFFIRLPLLAAIMAAGAIAAPALSTLMFDTPAWAWQIVIACAAIPLLSFAGYCGSVLQAREAFMKLGLVTLGKNAARLALLGAAAAAGILTPALAIELILAAAALALFLSVPITPLRALRAKGFDRGILAEMMSVNGWMTLAALGFLGARIDVMMLSSLAGPVEAGHYAAASQLSIAIVMLSTAIGTSLFPGAAKMTTLDLMRAHLRRVSLFLPFGLAATVAIPFAIGPLVPLFLGAAYAPAELPFQLLAASALLSLVTNPLLLLVFPAKMLPVYAATILGQLVLRVAADFVVIPLYGAPGAAAVDIAAKVITISVLASLIVLRLLRRDALVPAPVV